MHDVYGLYRRAAYVAAWLGMALVLVFFSANRASALETSQEPVKLSLELFRCERTPGPGPSLLAVLWIEPKDGWHTYTDEPGAGGFPTHVRAVLGEKKEELPVFFSPGVAKPEAYDQNLISNVYLQRTPVFIPVSTPPAGPVRLRTEVRMLMCTDTNCLPVETEVGLNSTAAVKSLPLAREQSWWPVWERASDTEQPTRSPQTPSVASEGGGDECSDLELSPRFFSPGLEVHSMGKAAILAFLAGLILNFMPCVLPVITLKLRAFVPVVEGDKEVQSREFREHNLFFALGMLVYFIILAAIIAVTGMAWGEIFQQPSAVLVLAAVVFALGLSLFGLYDLPVIDLKAGVGSHPRMESLFTGMLATILATPCSGPFLGGVLAWALIQPPMVIATVMFCIGVGMASPYLVMAVFPGMYRYLPSPGNWTIHLERILGFMLMATCVYLIGLLPSAHVLEALILFLVIAFAAWMWGAWTSLSQTVKKRWGIRFAAVLLVAVASFVLFRPPERGVDWKPFSTQDFLESLGRERMALDFTADWCPNCKFLEKAVLTPNKRAQWEEKYNVGFYQVDLTRQGAPGTELLRRLGSRSIPVLAVFSAERPESPLVLRDLFTAGQLEDALEQEFGTGSQESERRE